MVIAINMCVGVGVGIGIAADATIPDVYKANTNKQIHTLHTYICICTYMSVQIDNTWSKAHTYLCISLA